jgi:hypothetical protein
VRPVRGTAQVTSNEGLLTDDEVKIKSSKYDLICRERTIHKISREFFHSF